jgi:hypothetical protein
MVKIDQGLGDILKAVAALLSNLGGTLDHPVAGALDIRRLQRAWDYYRHEDGTVAEAGASIPEAVCFECQPNWNGKTTMQAQIVPTCTRCGRPCTGGCWMIQSAVPESPTSKTFESAVVALLEEMSRATPVPHVRRDHLFCTCCRNLVDDNSEAGTEPLHNLDIHCRATCAGFRARRLLSTRSK